MSKLINIINKIEDTILVGAFIFMLLVATSHIILRNFFDSGMPWSEPFIRNMVLWLTMLGAMVAARGDNHIRIDIIPLWWKNNTRHYLRFIGDIFTSIICAITSIYAYNLVLMEMEAPVIAFINIPIWLCQAIMPIGFGVIALRYFILSITRIINIIKHKPC